MDSTPSDQSDGSDDRVDHDGNVAVDGTSLRRRRFGLIAGPLLGVGVYLYSSGVLGGSAAELPQAGRACG